MRSLLPNILKPAAIKEPPGLCTSAAAPAKLICGPRAQGSGKLVLGFCFFFAPMADRGPAGECLPGVLVGKLGFWVSYT